MAKCIKAVGTTGDKDGDKQQIKNWIQKFKDLEKAEKEKNAEEEKKINSEAIGNLYFVCNYQSFTGA